ncbi:MAG: tRNA (guanosine(37)-N1)-methyltransferase TrmD [Anaerolineae bacterium]|nr:tRNA (guanosine(37)-N1)-methyltransferase TrmD [Anaerolineae bacterium]
MQIDIFTLFPGMFVGPFDDSIIRRALEARLVSIAIHDIRDWAPGKHRQCDDTPYGGGGGMVMKPEPVFAAVEDVLGMAPGDPAPCPVILLTPQGRRFTQHVARALAAHERLAMICGRYEGIDERVREHLVTDEVSIGDYVLSGGELAAMVIADAVIRLLPGVLGDPGAPLKDSHADGLLEHPHYTRPAAFRGWGIPEVLLSGHHALQARWRREMSLRRTYARRPDLLEDAQLSASDRAFLDALVQEREETTDDTNTPEGTDNPCAP